MDPEAALSAAASWAESSCHSVFHGGPVAGNDVADEVSRNVAADVVGGRAVVAWASLELTVRVNTLEGFKGGTHWIRVAFDQTSVLLDLPAACRQGVVVGGLAASLGDASSVLQVLGLDIR